MQVDARRRLPGVLVLGGVVVFVASTFLPWSGGTQPPISVALAVVALVLGGIVGLVMLVRRSEILAAVAGVLLIVVCFSLYTSGELDRLIKQDVGPGPYLAAVGVISILIGSVIWLARPRVAAATTPERAGQKVEVR